MADYMGDTNKQYDGQLIDEYYRLVRIRRMAKSENAAETIALIDEEIKILKMKILPIELLDLDN